MPGARSLAALLLAGRALVAGQSSSPCTPSSTFYTTVTVTPSGIDSTDISTSSHVATSTRTVDSTFYSTTITETKSFNSTTYTPCPASTERRVDTNTHKPAHTTLGYTSSPQTTTTMNKRQLASSSLETVMLYTCLASANGSALTSFVPGPSGTSNPGGAITVTLAHGQASTIVLTSTHEDGSIWYITEELIGTTGPGGAVSTLTVPIHTSIQNPPAAATTTSYVTTLSDGTVETIYESLIPQRLEGGRTSTATVPYTTVIAGRYGARTSTILSTLSDGTVETIFVSELPYGDSNGSPTATSTVPYATRIGGRYAATTSTILSTLSDGTVETIYVSVSPYGDSKGSPTATSTIPYATSFGRRYAPTTSSYTTTLADGTVETVYASFFPTGGDDGVATTTLTVPYATSRAFSSGGSSNSSTATSAAPGGSTSVVYAAKTTTNASGANVTLTSTAAGTLTFPAPVGTTSTTVIPTTFSDGPGYLGQRYYLDGSTTKTEVIGTFRLGSGYESLAQSDLVVTTVVSTVLNDGTQEFTTEAIYGSTGADNTVTTVTEPIATLIIRPSSSSTAFTTTTKVLDGTTSVVANAIYTTTSNGVVQTSTQPLGTYVYTPMSYAPASSAAPGSSNTAPTASQTPCPIPTVTVTETAPTAQGAPVKTTTDVTSSTTIDSTRTITTDTTITSSVTQTRTIPTLSTESYFGVYTAAVKDVNGYYPVFDTYHDLDFPYDDATGATYCDCGDRTDTGTVANKNCYGMTWGCQYNSIEACAELCIHYNNEKPTGYTEGQPCVGWAYAYNPPGEAGDKGGYTTHRCWLKSSIAPHPMRTAVGKDTCGWWNPYETLSGALRPVNGSTTYPTREAPNNGDYADFGDGPRHGDGRYSGINEA